MVFKDINFFSKQSHVTDTVGFENLWPTDCR